MHSCKNEIWWKAIMHLQQLGKLKNVLSTLERKKVRHWGFSRYQNDWFHSSGNQLKLLYLITALGCLLVQVFLSAASYFKIFWQIKNNKTIWNVFVREMGKKARKKKKENLQEMLQVTEKQSTHWANKSRQKISRN